MQYAGYLADTREVTDAIACAEAALQLLKQQAAHTATQPSEPVAARASGMDWRSRLLAYGEATGASVARSEQAVASRVGGSFDRALVGLISAQKDDSCVQIRDSLPSCRRRCQTCFDFPGRCHRAGSACMHRVCFSALHPGGIVLPDIQQIVLTNLEYFHLRVPSCTAPCLFTKWQGSNGTY